MQMAWGRAQWQPGGWIQGQSKSGLVEVATFVAQEPWIAAASGLGTAAAKSLGQAAGGLALRPGSQELGSAGMPTGSQEKGLAGPLTGIKKQESARLPMENKEHVSAGQRTLGVNGQRGPCDVCQQGLCFAGKWSLCCWLAEALG